ncbi:tripartite tricarboxylate transporter substrate binding protein [Pusillimonas sp. SM2304]|uniref:tripartite tricarboxylate transporter substrate binding protein n=1 Tax=Pusillimonas sp. SM2304 TaxID=3073241 RepID=UPI00287603B8|nr:tripartite tricarboxylate transporter substrate binding protein [Pusillimonas sp. SM2304]MDS1139038.1 tripartite tricarboxylate transporter substrate binding protein [Pusillimonas sp. SM2304]
MNFKQCFTAAVFGVALAASGSAFAWPDRPIELIVGFAPGGGTDLTARTLAKYLEQDLGQTVTVINKPGASGAIGLAYVGRAKPDGYTLAMTNMPGLVSLPIERKAGFTLDSFTYLANLVRDPSAFSVKLDSPYKSMKDLIAEAGKEAEAISYGSTGVGTDDHLALVLFEQATGVQLNHVPFNGAGPLRNALLGGHTDVGGMNLGEAMPYNGEVVRILGQASEKRSPLAPDVPTFKEQGIDLVFASERGVVAPKGLPEEVSARLREALKKVAAEPEFQQHMQQQFTEMDYLDGDAWLARLKESDERFRKLWAEQPWTE